MLNFSLITVNRVRAIVLDLDPLMLKEKHDQLYIFFPFLTCIKIIWIHFNLKVLNSSNMREKRGTRENLNFFFFLNIHGCMEKPRNIYTREESCFQPSQLVHKIIKMGYCPHTCLGLSLPFLKIVSRKTFNGYSSSLSV